MPLKPHTFTKTVSAAGTKERLTTQEINVPAVLIQGISTNTGDVYIGDNQVSSTNGIEVDARDGIVISAKALGWADENISLKDIWIDVDTNGEGVNVLFLGRN